VSPVYLFIF